MRSNDHALAISPDLLRSVPDDAAVAYFWEGPRSGVGSPTKSENDANQDGNDGNQGVAALAATVIDAALRVGALSMVDPAMRPWIDGVAATMAAARFPFALILFDVQVGETDDGGHECADIRAALVLLTRKDNDDIERRIRHLLASYTNQFESTLDKKDDEGRTRFTLQDRRLVEWAMMEWGAVGDYYVLAIGHGSFDRVIDALTGQTADLTGNAWFKKAAVDLTFNRAAIGLLVRPGTVVRDAKPDIRRRIVRVRHAMHLLGTQQSLLTVNREGLVVTIRAANERGNMTTRHTIAGGELMADLRVGLIPNEATRCTAIDWDPPAVLRAIQDGVLSTRSPRHQEELRTFWRDVEARSGVSIERDIVANLGDPLIIHNAPKHALNLPLTWNFVVPIRGDGDSLSRKLNQLFEYTQRAIDPDAILQLRRDADGIWFLSAGLTGPALGMTDREIVISFSPSAVRENLERLRTPTGDTP